MQNDYLSSNSFSFSTEYPIIVLYFNGVGGSSKSAKRYVWPVRGKTSGPCKIWRTGQTYSYAAGDDGDLQQGVTWPDPRFRDNSDGTITDYLTGLMWLKDANCFGSMSWQDLFPKIDDFNG